MITDDNMRLLHAILTNNQVIYEHRANIVKMYNIRRATIVDGQIADKKCHPGSIEIPQVSILLENEREKLGMKSISRFTTILVEEAIMTNDPSLWKTIIDDIETKDFDIPAVHSLFSQNVMLPSLWVTCISTAKSRDHILDMLVFFYEISKNVPTEVKEAISTSITCQWKSFVNCMITVMSSASSRVKDVYFSEIAKFVDSVAIGSESIALMMNEIIKMRKFELLAVFWLTDFKTCVDTALFELLLKTSSPKHSTVLAVAKAVEDNPDFLDSHSEDIEKMILETIRVIMRSGYGDRRVLNAVGYLAGKVFEDNPTARGMATLLCWSTNA